MSERSDRRAINTARPLAILAVVPVTAFVLLSIYCDGFRHQFSVVTGVDAARLQSRTSEIGWGIAWDVGFIATWWIVVELLCWGAYCWLPPYRRRLARYTNAWWLAAIAAGLDLLEDALLGAATQWHPTGFLVVLATVGWVKTAAYLAAVAAAIVIVVGATVGRWLGWQVGRILGYLLDRLNKTPRDAPAPPVAALPRPQDDRGVATSGPSAGTGICVSGGGIRSAAVALGAFRRLDTPDAYGNTVFRSASWLASVSGGGYTAGGWRASNAGATPHAPSGAAASSPFAKKAPWARYVRDHHRYLDNGCGSLTGGIVGALVRTALVLATITGAAVVAGWCWGLFVSSRYIIPDHHCLITGRDCPAGMSLTSDRLVWPGLVLLIIGVAALLISGLRPSWRAAQRSVGLGCIAAGVTLFVVLVGLAAAVRYDRTIIGWIYLEITPHTNNNSAPAGSHAGAVWLAVLSGLGVLTAIVNIVVSQVKKRWLRLGGVLLGVLLFVVAEVFAHVIAAGNRPPLGSFHGAPTLVLLTAAVWVLIEFVPTHRLSLAGIYRKRLAGTFITAPTENPSTVAPMPYSNEPRWASYKTASGPRLIVSATAHSSVLTQSGLKGCGFTFDTDQVALFDAQHGQLGSTMAMADYPIGSWWYGFPRGWSVSRSMALSGAAIASAMGRQALGTTNALLAALNVRLGMWIPNPRFAAHDFPDDKKADWPRVGLTYLAKELLGHYRLDKDPFIYVADGGHRENLGLVELLRRRPATVYVIDASGDTPGEFTTLRQAIDLAFRELQITIELDWEPITIAPDSKATLPSSCVTTGTIHYPDGCGLLIYGRNQLSQKAPHHLIEFDARYPKFPDYPTTNQFLTEPEFAALEDLGDHVAAEMLKVASGRKPGLGADDCLARTTSATHAAAVADSHPDEQDDHRADNGADDAGGLEEAVLAVVVEYQIAEKSADERADNAE